jgi:dihydrolipoamide dehydrogenase
MEQTFDLTVIGSGSGGYVAAIRACQLGLKVAVVEDRQAGGTCLNRGCIPTKALLHSADIYHLAKSGGDFGIEVDNIRFNYSKMVSRKGEVVEQLRSGVEGLLRNNGAVLLNGKATIKDRNTIEVAGDEIEVIKTEKMIIATGARPMKVNIPGIDGKAVLDSDGLLEMTECPDSLVIIGGGVIGMEFATLFNALGKDVTVIEMLDTILPGTDREISDLLRAILESRGVKIYTGAKLISIEADGKAICNVEIGGTQKKIEADKVLVAIGRKPNSSGLGLENIGVELEKGFIQVNDKMETSVDGIYAVGDVTGKIQLAHVASAQGLTAATNAAGKSRKMNYSVIPSCIYSHPEIAVVGLSEVEALSKGYKIKVGRFPVGMNGKSMVMGEKEGLAKIITDETTGEILGAQIMGPRATDMIGEICVAMNLESTIEEVGDTIHPHPTVGEIIMEAAHDVEGLCIHKPKI